MQTNSEIPKQKTQGPTNSKMHIHKRELIDRIHELMEDIEESEAHSGAKRKEVLAEHAAELKELQQLRRELKEMMKQEHSARDRFAEKDDAEGKDTRRRIGSRRRMIRRVGG
jgi:hypothetical protein